MNTDQIQRLIDVNPDPVLIAARISGRIHFINKAAEKLNIPAPLTSRQQSDAPIFPDGDGAFLSLFDLITPQEKEKLSSFLSASSGSANFYFRMDNSTSVPHKLCADEFDDDKLIISFRADDSFSSYEFGSRLFDNLNDAVIVTNPSFEITAYNKTAERIYGWTKSEAVGQHISQLLKTEMTDAELKNFYYVMSVDGSVKWTATRRNKNGEPVFTEVTTFSTRDERGRLTGYVSVNKDITSSLMTQEKLKRSEERYRNIFDENSMPIIIYDESDYSILRVNKAAVSKYEYSAEEFCMLKLPALVPPDQRFIFINVTEQAKLEKRSAEFETISRSGKRIYISYTSTRVKYKDYDARLVVINDITEKHRAEEKLQESSSKLDRIVNNLPMVLLELDSGGKFVLQEGRALTEAGFQPGQLVGSSFHDLLGSVKVTQNNGEVIDAMEAFNRVMKGYLVAGQTNIAGRYFDNYFVPVRRGDDKPSGLLGICLDITERVNLEKSYLNTEQRFRLIAENTSELISMVSEGRYVYISPSYEKLFGYTMEEIRQMGPLALVHRDDLPLLNRWQTKGMVEFRVRNKSGDYLQVEGESFKILGEPEITVGIARDITKRKAAEEALKDSEERYRMLFERNPLPLFVYDEETFRFLAVNESAVEHYGYSKDEFMSMTIMDIRPTEDIPVLKEVLRTQKKGMKRFGVWRHILKNGVIINVDVTTHAITFNGRPARLTLADDVTAEVKAAHALKDSEEKYRRIVENANEGILLIDTEGIVTFVNNKLAEIVGYSREEIEQRPVTDFVFEEDQSGAERYIRENSEGSRTSFEFRLKHKNGSERRLKVNAVPVFDEQSVYAGGLALITDITEQRKAEAEYQRLNEMLRSLINYSPLSVVILDGSGNTELWNPASERMFGWSSSEVLGRPLPFVPQEKMEEHLSLRNTVMKGESFTGREVVRQRKNGKKINVSIAAAPLLDSNHSPIGISSFLEDISEKKKSEKEREKLFKQITAARNRLKVLSSKLISVQESEKRSISRELHDEIGQMLTAVKIDLQRIRDGNHLDEVIELADDCTSLVENTISVVRNLSLELRPAIIDDLGLAASLRWYLDKFQQRTGIKVNTAFKKISNVLPPECAITLFRISQEALTNIAKHAEAGYVWVSLNETKSSLVLTIEDDGKGFDTQKALRLAARGKSLGLISMQERAELLGGKFSIKSKKGSGTIIMASCRIKNE